MYWQKIETAPKDKEFQVFCVEDYGDQSGTWYPRCKIEDGIVYEYTMVSKNWQSYMDWVVLCAKEFCNHLFWAPIPENICVNEYSYIDCQLPHP